MKEMGLFHTFVHGLVGLNCKSELMRLNNIGRNWQSLNSYLLMEYEWMGMVHTFVHAMVVVIYSVLMRLRNVACQITCLGRSIRTARGLQWFIIGILVFGWKIIHLNSIKTFNYASTTWDVVAIFDLIWLLWI